MGGGDGVSVIFINPYQFAAAGDPFLPNVSLLLHGNGVNGSTGIIDSSPSPKAITVVGNAQISTAQSKFGGSSIAFDGNGDWLVVGSQSALSFGTANFTIESWLRLSNTGAIQLIVDARNSTSAVPWNLYINTDRTVSFRHGGGVLTSSQTFTYDTWFHFALTRSGSTIRMFIDGVLDLNTDINTGALDAGTSNLFIGRVFDSASLYLSGYIDEFRVTPGIARYVSSFTPPIAPFPDS